MKTNPFSGNNYILGNPMDTPLTVEDVNQLFSSPKVTPVPCYICGEQAKYKLVPHGSQPMTAQIDRMGYVCGICVNKKLVDPKSFRLKELYTDIVPGGGRL